MDSKGRVLVVDDDHAIRKLLERIARRAGFEVHSAKDGLEALEMMDAAHYDVALIDLMMPRLSGYELVERLGMREKRPVVIVATAMTNAEVASVDDTMVRRVIRKPFDVDAVATALKEAAEGLQSAAAAEAAEDQPASSEPAAPPVNSPSPC